MRSAQFGRCYISRRYLNNNNNSDESNADIPFLQPFTHTLTNTTVLEALHIAVDTLNKCNIPDPISSAVQLLAQALQLPWDTGYTELMLEWEHQTPPTTTTTAHPSLREQQRLNASEAGVYSALLQRRQQHEPIQYIAGQWDFLKYTMQVRAPLLCPRPETEEMVQRILDQLRSEPKQLDPYRNIIPKSNPILQIFDIGCGTGCIGIALADQIKDARVTAIDVEPIAVETSMVNAQTILGSNWNSRYSAQLASCQDYVPEIPFDLVVSNPPYILQDDMKLLDRTVIEYESETALYGGSPDGMNIIRTIVQRLSLWCRPGAVCWMEVDPSHPGKLHEWLSIDKSLNVTLVSVHRDMFGNNRFVQLVVNEDSATPR